MNTTVMLIDLSRENVSINFQGKTYEIHRSDIETKFSEKMLYIAEKNSISDIYIIQGPGSFTNIRVAVLLINAFVMFAKQKPQLHTLTKPEFLSHIRKKYTDTFPGQVLLFIGQKKNVRKYDLSDSSFTKITIANKELVGGAYTDNPQCEGKNVELLLPYTIDQENIVVATKEKSFTIAVNDFPWKHSTTLQPLYEIEPDVD